MNKRLETIIISALIGAVVGALTVFGVISSWVKDGEIKSEYLEKIKRICPHRRRDLSGGISPIGSSLFKFSAIRHEII